MMPIRNMLLLGFLLGFTAYSSAANWQEGDIIKVTLGQLNPTQSVVAHDQIAYKLAHYRTDSKALYADLCETAGLGQVHAFTANSSPKSSASYQCEQSQPTKQSLKYINTVVLGPDQQLYLTDGHHTFSAFFDMPDGGADLTVYVQLQKIYRTTEPANFWQQMQQDGNTWLFDAEGQPISYQALPKQLGRQHLQNDPYRAALFFLRGSAWQKPNPAIPFVEFYWAQYLRAQPHLRFLGYYSAAEYLQWLERINQHLASLSPDTILHGTFSAKALGLKTDKDLSHTLGLLCKRGAAAVSFGRLGLALQERGMPVHCDSKQY